MIKIISSKESQQGVISLRRSSSLIGKPNRHLEEVQGCRKSRTPKATAEGRGRTQPENKGSPAREEGGAVPIREEGSAHERRGRPVLPLELCQQLLEGAWKHTLGPNCKLLTLQVGQEWGRVPECLKSSQGTVMLLV